MGPPQKLMLNLATEFRIKDFVETGTYYGRTAVWASKAFERVSTIENSKEIYERTKNKCQYIDNIDFLFGDSRAKLDELCQALTIPSIFWLDAHWSGGQTYGDSDQCPLLEELRIINNSGLNHFIFIDDARLFLSPPQPPHKIEQWPNITEIFFTLKENCKDKYIVITEDVIVAVPSYATEVVVAYCQEVNAKAWEEYGKSIKQSNLQKALDLVKLDMTQRVKPLLSKLSKK